ncbi:MAG: FAD:protein FMN transferase [Planctomycetota bacterium]|jgi:thiamine biosynthesis lipoprotein
MPLRMATHCMGTRFELVLHGEDERFLRAAGEQAISEIEDCHARFSLFRRDSLLGRINRDATSGWVCVDAEAFELLALCDEIVDQSCGAFDPTVATLMREYGFHDHGGSIEDAALGWEHVELDHRARAIRFHRSGLSLDLGGVAKGYGLDLAARSLREEGIDCAFLQGGSSSMLALGQLPGAHGGWRVALDVDPQAPMAQLENCALSLSAPHGRTLYRDAEMITHVMDPAAGRPIENDLLRAAVLAESAALSDAWSTALLVRGRQLDPPAELRTLIASRSTAPASDGLDWQLDDALSPHSTGSYFCKPIQDQQSA